MPATGITFTNDGNAQTSLDYYNFLIASPIVLGGVVYADTNGNGVRDPGEKGIAGADVTISPPSGSAIHATTDATGAWSATAYMRGDYRIDVDAPTDGTITTPTMSFSFDSPSMIAVHGSFDFTDHYSNSGAVSLWDPVTQQYRPWLLAMIDDLESFDSQGVNFVDLAGGATGNTNALNTAFITAIPKNFDVFLGKWSASGEPTPSWLTCGTTTLPSWRRHPRTQLPESSIRVWELTTHMRDSRFRTTPITPTTQPSPRLVRAVR